MASSRILLKSARLFHLYSGVFLTPAFLFFAFTGGVQTFSLHETTRGSSYKPPAILVTLGQLHKKQTIVVPVRKGPPDTKPGADAHPGPEPRAAVDLDHPGDHTRQQKHDRPAQEADSAAPTAPAAASTPPSDQAPTPAPRVHNLLPMKIFFLIAALGFFFSTLTGLYMAYKYTRNKVAITVTLLAGAIIPPLLLLF